MEDGEVISTVAEGGCSVWTPAGLEGTGALQYQLQGRSRGVPSFCGSDRLGFKVKTWRCLLLPAPPPLLQAWRPTPLLPWCSCRRCCAWCPSRSTTSTCRCSWGQLFSSHACLMLRVRCSAAAATCHSCCRRPHNLFCPIWIALHTFLHSQSTLQVTVAKICLPHILAAVRNNVGELEVVSKGLILLGVLCQARWLGHVAHKHLRCIRHALHRWLLCCRVK